MTFRASTLAVSLLVFSLPWAAAQHSVRDHGAKGDGVARDTAAIQAAIDAAAKHGGGTVLVPPGKYLSGTIHLKSNITLELSGGAVLTALPDANALLDGRDLNHVAIQGFGTIHGAAFGLLLRGGANVRVSGCDIRAVTPVVISGAPDRPVRNIVLAGLSLTTEGGGKFAGLAAAAPAQALHVRHAERVVLRDVSTRSLKPDERPALVLDGVKEFEMSGFHPGSASGALPLVWLHDVAGALLTGNRIPLDVPLFLRVTGRNSKAIGIVGNDLRLAHKTVDVTDKAPVHAVELTGNLAPGRLPAID